ncbi:hypothetical protein ACFX2C_040818 [Malus domestica]
MCRFLGWCKLLDGGQVDGALLKLLSLQDGLGLEAVRDRHAAGCSVCDSGRTRSMLQASWCSMKLSTLEKTRPQSQECPLVLQVLRCAL